MALADVEGAKIHFKDLVLSHQIASVESVQEILVSHYSRQFLHEMYKVTFLTLFTFASEDIICLVNHVYWSSMMSIFDSWISQ